MPVQVHNDKVTVALSNGSTVEILRFGATVISWKSPGSGITANEIKERFFVSKKSAMDGSKPIRGGIPVVFPFFGPPTREEHKAFPSHGFGRTETWIYGGVVFETDASVAVKFILEPTPEISAKFSVPFILEYIVTLTTHQLNTALHVTNPASSPSILIHQALLHNYIAAEPTESITISPLSNITYTDKIKGGAEVVEHRALVDVKQVTDSVYRHAPGEAGYEVRWTGGGMDIKTNSGFPDVVIWNPHAEVGSKIADMEDGGWERYVCVEPGFVSSWNHLEAGQTWIGTQLFSPL